MSDKKHACFVKFMEDHFFSPENVIYSMIDRKTLLPATEEIFKDCPPRENNPDAAGHFIACVPGFSRSEFINYENCCMATGSAMASTMMEYKRTKNSAVLERAKRLFSGIKTICDCGKSFEEGFIPKFYGGRFTYQTSTDQCFYLIWGLDMYYESADSSERSFIEKQIPAIADFWMRHNYTWSYFQFKDMVWPPLRFPPILLMAWYYSGDIKYKKEADKIMAENIDCIPEFDRVARFRNRRFCDYEEKYNIRVMNCIADSSAMDTMNLSVMIRFESDSEFVPVWKKGIVTTWDQAKTAIQDDGMAYTGAFYDVAKKKIVKPYSDTLWHWAKTSWSSVLVRGGLMALSYMPEKRDEVMKYAKLVLDSLEPEKMVYWDELKNFPPDCCYHDKLLCGTALANYLWAWELLKKEKCC